MELYELPELRLPSGTCGNIRRVAATLSLVCLLAACTDDLPAGESFDSPEVIVQANEDFPPGTAEVLSIAGTAALSEGSSQATDVSCAAAIQVTSRLLTERLPSFSPAQAQALNQAERIYRQRALATSGGSLASIAEAIEQEIERNRESPALQTRLAAACLKEISPEA